MNNKKDFIEYGGITFQENNANNFLEKDFSFYINLDHPIQEIIKINGEVSKVKLEKIHNKIYFCILKLETSLEYISSKNNNSLALISNEKYFSLSLQDVDENFNIYIKNLKGKLVENDKILVYYNIVFSRDL